MRVSTASKEQDRFKWSRPPQVGISDGQLVGTRILERTTIDPQSALESFLGLLKPQDGNEHWGENIFTSDNLPERPTEEVVQDRIKSFVGEFGFLTGGNEKTLSERIDPKTDSRASEELSLWYEEAKMMRAADRFLTLSAIASRQALDEHSPAREELASRVPLLRLIKSTRKPNNFRQIEYFIDGAHAGNETRESIIYQPENPDSVRDIFQRKDGSPIETPDLVPLAKLIALDIVKQRERIRLSHTISATKSLLPIVKSEPLDLLSLLWVTFIEKKAGGWDRIRQCESPRCRASFYAGNSGQRFCSETCGSYVRNIRKRARDKVSDQSPDTTSPPTP